MRTFLSGLLTLIAMVAVVLAVPSVWVTERIVDQDGFVQTIRPMGAEQEVKDYLADEIARQVGEQSGLPGGEFVARKVAQSYTNSPGFEDDFADVVGQQHAWLFDEPKAGTDTRVMQLDITRMVQRALSESGIDIEVRGPLLVPLTHGDSGLEAGRYHQVGKQITTLGYGSAAVAIAAAVLALIIGRRRGAIFAWLGVGVALAGLSSWAVGVFLANRAKREVEGTEDAGRRVAELIIDRVGSDLTQVAVITGAVGLGMVVVGVLGHLVIGRR